MHSGAKLPPRGAAKSARGVGPGAPGSRPQQKKSMAKQKDSMGRCTVRPQRAKDGSVDKNVPRSRSNKGNLTELYALLFVRFNRRWEEVAPPNVMAFQDIRSEFLAQVERDDADGVLAHQEP